MTTRPKEFRHQPEYAVGTASSSRSRLDVLGRMLDESIKGLGECLRSPWFGWLRGLDLNQRPSARFGSRWEQPSTAYPASNKQGVLFLNGI
jgi:hypothetical protein